MKLENQTIKIVEQDDNKNYFLVARNYVAILLVLIVLVALITTLLYYYNTILDVVFSDHKELQRDGNLINFFEKTFGLAVTLLVSSVALVIALLSIKIMRQQTYLIDQQTKLAQRQFDFELRSHVNEYFDDNFSDTVKVYEIVNKVFHNLTKIEKYKWGSGAYIDTNDIHKTENTDYEYLINDPEDVKYNTPDFKEHKKRYDDFVEPIFDELKIETYKLLQLICLRSLDVEFNEILKFCSSGNIEDIKEYSYLVDEWQKSCYIRDIKIFKSFEDFTLHDISVKFHEVRNIAIEMSCYQDTNIINYIGRQATKVGCVVFEKFTDVGQYNNFYKVLPEVILAAIILHSPKRVFMNIDLHHKIDDSLRTMLEAKLDKVMTRYQNIFYLNGEEIYPNYSEEVKSNITSESTTVYYNEY